jgi:hypothetical protein
VDVPPPALWGCLVRFLGLTPAEQRQWWQAVQQARWSVVVSWRLALGLSPSQPTPLQLQAFLDGPAHPQQLMTVLEQLAQEGGLARPLVGRLEEAILARVQADGTWRYDPLPTSGRRH